MSTLHLEPGTVCPPHDLQLVWNEHFERASGRQEVQLSGPRALEVELQEQELSINRLHVQLSNGERHRLEPLQIPLPAPSEAAYAVTLAFVPEKHFVRPGSTVSTWRPTVRLATSLAADQELLTIGFWERGEFRQSPVLADRCDASAALAAWAQRVQDLLTDLDGKLMTISLRLARVEAPALVWQAILAPAWHSLSAARDFAATDSPQQLLRRVRGVLRELSQLWSRAAQVGDRQIVALGKVLGAIPPPEMETKFAAECHQMEQGLGESCLWLDRLYRCLGTPRAGLPEVYYHAGRLYLQQMPIQWTPVVTNETRQFWLNADSSPNTRSRKSSVAILWRTAAPSNPGIKDSPRPTVEFGEVTFFNQSKDTRLHELFLGRVEASEPHWIPNVSLAGACLETSSQVEPAAAALYLPYE